MTTNKLILKQKILQNKLSEKTKSTLFYSTASVVVFAIIIMLAANPKAYSTTTLQGLNLFVVAVLPGLLPFMFLTKVLTSLGMVKKLSAKCGKLTNTLFGTPGISGYVAVMSMISGYPIGAKLIADLTSANAINSQHAKRMISFCTTSGPIFVIGSVGSIMFGNATVGLVLYLSHILGSIMSGIALNLLEKMGSLRLFTKSKTVTPQHNNYLAKKNTKSNKLHKQTTSCLVDDHTTIQQCSTPERIEKIISDSMADTVSSILIVGAYIAIFFLLAQMLMDIGMLSGLASLFNKLLAPLGITNVGDGLAGGLLEVTRGCSLLGKSVNTGSICIACAVISFSGLSIIMQSMNFLHKANISFGYFVAIKLLNAVISALICWPLCLLFGV